MRLSSDVNARPAKKMKISGTATSRSDKMHHTNGQISSRNDVSSRQLKFPKSSGFRQNKKVIGGFVKGAKKTSPT